MRKFERGTRAVLLATAGLSLVWSTAEARPRHVRAPDPRDAEIQALKEQVQALSAKVDSLAARKEAEVMEL